MGIDRSLILEGASIGYVEVFGEKDNEVFRFSYNNREYFVDDQYCMNPKCKCNDAILTIFELHPHQIMQDNNPYTRVRLNLEKNKYKIEHGHSRSHANSSVVDFFVTNQREAVKLLKKRYQEMKAKGKELLSPINEAASQKTQSAASVGRNDPCTCGSGQKYKKCCGR
jgi:uncharacterized protein YchJ